MLVPYSGCGETDKFAEYYTARGEIALAKENLLPITAQALSRNSTQVCSHFGLHPNTRNLQRLYNAGDALWVANAGNLDEPITKSEYDSKTKRRPAQLFAHNTQTKIAQNLDARMSSRTDGVLGRMMDAFGDVGIRTNSYSIAGAGATVLEPEVSTPFDVLGSTGVTRLAGAHAALVPGIKNLTSHASRSPFANMWSSLVGTTLNRTDELAEVLTAVTLNQPFAATATAVTSRIGAQFEQVAKLIKANQDSFSNEREAYYVQLGGFDVHADAIDKMELLMNDMDLALASFEAEMKSQGLWNNVTIVQGSEFGRTISSNGDGSDHAWGGNYWLAGGAVRGGQILGQFPEDLTEEGMLNLGRGRMIPTTSWDQIWNGVGAWFGVSESAMREVLPRRDNFPNLFTEEDLFSG